MSRLMVTNAQVRYRQEERLEEVVRAPAPRAPPPPPPLLRPVVAGAGGLVAEVAVADPRHREEDAVPVVVVVVVIRKDLMHAAEVAHVAAGEEVAEKEGLCVHSRRLFPSSMGAK